MINNSSICFGCVTDDGLSKIIKRGGWSEVCLLCKKNEPALKIRTIAKRVAKVFDDHFISVPVEESGGISLDECVAKILSAQHDDLLVQLVTKELGKPRKDWVPPNLDCKFRQPVTDSSILGMMWLHVKAQIKHGRRFFNDDAKKFLDMLFQDVSSEKSSLIHYANVIYQLEGISIYRGRHCDSSDLLDRVTRSPSKELGAPPPTKATAGRMNAAGITAFYGAFDRSTCIAELRPHVGGNVITAEFQLTRALQVFDFRALQSAYNTASVSFFDPGYELFIARKAFLEDFHHQISSPVLPLDHHEYLATQIVAEYLATQFHPRIDAVIFNSSQLKLKPNIVIFNHNFEKPWFVSSIDVEKPSVSFVPNQNDDAFRYIDGSLVVHRISEIHYVANEFTIPISTYQLGQTSFAEKMFEVISQPKN